MYDNLLAQALRSHADKVKDRTDAELIRCLARLLEGSTPYKAFGAPGDWGYDTPIGTALAADYASAPA